MDDRELVQKLIAKDEAAYRYLYETYQEKIYKACVYLLGYQDPDAEDVTQEVFLAAFQQLPQFEFRSSFFHWIYRICMYLCYDRLEKRKRMIVSLNEDMESMVGPLSLERQKRELEGREKERVLVLMEEQKKLLGAPCRDLLDLREKEEKSYIQISETLKVPMGTVMSRLARCKKALKELLLRALKEVDHG